MKALLLLIFSSTLVNNVFAYNGCREIYREYDTEIWSKYNIDIGNGNDIYLVLRCTSDCYSLSMGGDRSGNATLCGTKKSEGSWVYYSCGGSTKSAPYGTGAVDVGNLMLSYCNEESNRKVNRKNADARRWNKKIARDGLDSSKKIIPETQDRIKLVNSLVDIYSDTSEKSICLKKGVIKLKKALSLFTAAKEKYRKALNSDSNVNNYYEEAKELYNKGIGEYNTSTKLCFSDSSKITQDKSSSSKTKKFGKFATVFDPISNVRKKPNGDILCKIKTVKKIEVKKYNNDWYSTTACEDLGYIHKSQIQF